ncbi:prostate stem cell antigen isoform X5 [Mustela erminea]|uniref:prostate stem cell antigen isoform X5 n=1 Tax=Mustela erminea TaxID=36723 RepID=UPI0013872573|nr:prostate stem cell antigen isoform X5 [Mustela erminea]
MRPLALVRCGGPSGFLPAERKRTPREGKRKTVGSLSGRGRGLARCTSDVRASDADAGPLLGPGPSWAELVGDLGMRWMWSACGAGGSLWSPESSPGAEEGAPGAALGNLPSMSWASSSRPAFPDLSSEHGPASPRQRTPAPRPHTGAPSGCAVPQPAGLHLKARPEAAEPLTQILEASGSALRCYSCKAQASNHDCQQVRNCTSSETYCWTERIRVVDIVTRISKGCMSHCVDDAQNYYVGKKNITCCSTDLCNASGAHALRPAAVALALLTTLGGLLLWGPSRL